jgi:hypothetical protein
MRTKELLYFLGFFLLISGAAMAAPDTGTTPVRVTVTVSGPEQQLAHPLTARDVQVYQDRRLRPVIDWTPVAETRDGFDLAILIDDSVGRNIALQFPDIRTFIDGLPANTNVGVAYAEFGAARFKQPFTLDRNLAEGALQIPEGRVDVGGSIYQSVTDLVKHWPSDGRVRVALLVSDGVDVNRGLSETDPALNPDLSDAIHEAQTAGVTFYAIFAGSSARFEHRGELNLNGQGSLNRLASETGGEAYFQGTRTPISYKPFLAQLRGTLGRQYVLTFAAEARNDARNSDLRVTTEVPHVKVTAPSQVHVPAAR